MRRYVILVAVLASACGSSTTPATPSTPAASTSTTTTSAPVATSFTGTLTATNGGQPLGGISLSSGGSTDGSGRFTAPAGTTQITFSGAAILTRVVRLQAPGHVVAPDAIALNGFDTTFYRQLARGTFDGTTVYPITRWTQDARVFIRTVDSANVAIEPEVLTLVADWSRRAVSTWTSGQFSVVQLDQGPSDPGERAGWIVVEFRRDPKSNACGQSRLGQNPGRITLWDDRCNCGSEKVPRVTVLHEFGHAMGMFHVNDRQSVMYPQDPGGCPVPTLSPRETADAAIMYSRPNGNLDPDDDSRTSSALAEERVIAN